MLAVVACSIKGKAPGLIFCMQSPQMLLRMNTEGKAADRLLVGFRRL